MTNVSAAARADKPGRIAQKCRTVVVIDDHKTFADLLQVALSGEADLDCVGVAYDLGSGLALVHEQRPDLVVIDYHFAGDERDGASVAALIGAQHQDTQVVLLTGYADARLMQRAAEAGVSSLMAKDGSLPDLLTALRTARRGGLMVHPGLLMSMVTQPRQSRAHRPDLSQRERDVLAMLTLGLDARAIAHRLGISLNTCRGYVKTLLRKLDAHSQLEAVAIARRHGLVDAAEVE
ncbi:MAG: response regulator transcription factor [Marmoricola sp.]